MPLPEISDLRPKEPCSGSPRKGPKSRHSRLRLVGLSSLNRDRTYTSEINLINTVEAEVARKQVKMGMFTLVVFFAFLIAIPSAALAQGPNKTVQENPCDQVDFTKKWQCESDRLQADRDRQRSGTPEEKLRLSCQHLSQLPDSCHSRMKPADCFSFQENRAECILRGWWRRGPDKSGWF